MESSKGRVVPLYLPIKEAHLELHWCDRGVSHTKFETVKELADFLKDNPILAAAVEYFIKEPKEIAEVKLILPENMQFLKPEAQAPWLANARNVIDSYHGKVIMGKRVFADFGQLQKYLDEGSRH